MPRCPIDGVKTFSPPTFDDDRGSFSALLATRLHGLKNSWKEVNFSRSDQGVIRGLHLQHPHAQAKFLTVTQGRIWDLVLDLRPDSPTFQHWCYYVLGSDLPRSQIYIPAGCAHGFATPEGSAEVLYLVDDIWTPEDELTIAWDDPELAIPWPVESPSLSPKDADGMSLPNVLRRIVEHR